MKKIFAFIIFILCFASVFANVERQDESVSKKSTYKDRKLYDKYVYYPLKQASYDITSGTIEFKMSIWKNSEETPTVYNCKMEFARWPSVNFLLPNITLTIGDSIRYVMDKDSLHTFNLLTKTHEVDSFNTAINFLGRNQFISFYAHWYRLCGKVTNTTVLKGEEFISANFEILDADEKQYCITGAGEYQFVYHVGDVLLQKHSYEPEGRWKEKYGFKKIQYELISFEPGTSQPVWTNMNKKEKNCIITILQSSITMHQLGHRTYDGTIVDCNTMISIMGNSKEDIKYPYLK